MCETLYSHQIMIQHWATDNHIRSGQQITVWSKVPKQIGTNQMSRFFRIHIYGARNNRRQQQQQQKTPRTNAIWSISVHENNLISSNQLIFKSGINGKFASYFLKIGRIWKMIGRRPCHLIKYRDLHLDILHFFSAFSTVAVRLVWIGSILVWFIFLFCGIILSNCLTIILFNAQIK